LPAPSYIFQIQAGSWLGYCRVRKFPGTYAFHAYFNRTGSFSVGGNITLDISLSVWFLPPNPVRRLGRNARVMQALLRAKQTSNAAAGRRGKVPLTSRRSVKTLQWGAGNRAPTQDAQTQSMWAVPSAKYGTRPERGKQRMSREKRGCAAGPAEQAHHSA
jgi:hypothetical protein